MEELKQSEKESFPQRTEEVQHIIDRMPTKFGKVVSLIVLSIFLLLIIIGWQIRYPDIITGQINIIATQAPIKMVSAYPGKLKLSNLKSQDRIREGEIIAWLENPASIHDVQLLSSIIDSLALPQLDPQVLYRRLPKDLNLGELSPKYFSFLNAVKLMADYYTNRLYDKQLSALEDLLEQQNNVLIASQNKLGISRENLVLINRLSARDSILHSRQVLSDGDMDRSRINTVGARDSYEAASRDVANSQEQISRTYAQVQERRIQRVEKEQQLNLELLTAYNDLRDNIASWEQRYVFRAPLDGRVQFLNFWNENQFIQAAEPIFTILPEQERVIGQVLMPASGAGKVEVEQEVIIKLADYPYMEYGSITGYIETISLTTNAVKSELGNTETYLVTVDFPQQLETNYGTILEFKYDMKGTAEIITNDRRLIQRFFDNMKYIMKK